MSTQPTPEDLEALARKHGATSYRNRADTQNPAYGFSENGLRNLLADAIARWGTPATGGEPVAWMDDFGNAFPLAANKGAGSWMDAHKRTWKPLYTSPQPVREPLTCEWSHNDDDGFWETSCGDAWRFDDGGPKENSMNFCHGCGKTLRITGGQHGTE